MKENSIYRFDNLFLIWFEDELTFENRDGWILPPPEAYMF